MFSYCFPTLGNARCGGFFFEAEGWYYNVNSIGMTELKPR